MNAFATGVAGGARRADSSIPAPSRDVLALFLAGLADGWSAWRRYQHLRALDDAALARRGIARGDIARHAVLGVSNGR
jgi:hypothetical protein